MTRQFIIQTHASNDVVLSSQIVEHDLQMLVETQAYSLLCNCRISNQQNKDKAHVCYVTVTEAHRGEIFRMFT